MSFLQWHKYEAVTQAAYTYVKEEIITSNLDAFHHFCFILFHSFNFYSVPRIQILVRYIFAKY